MPPAKIVNLDMHAIATLRYIRASMDAASNVAVPGSAGIAMGFIGLATAALSLLPQLASHWISVWLAAAPISATVGGLLLARPASLSSFIATGTPGRKLALGLLPSLFAGAVMTAVLWSAEQMLAIPGTWLLLYGCALVSASVSTTMIVAWMGGCFAALGIVAFIAPAPFQIPLLGAGFGGLHILFGILIGRGAHGRES
ncbi:MAG: hypothetical protein ABW171_04595 [Steroidobacter sp.]